MSDVARDLEDIRDYLQGRLSAEQELVFQDRLARDPSLVSELEQSLRLREGLRQLKAEGYLATPAARMHDSPSRRMQRWLVPAAAAAVIAFVGVSLWWESASVLTATPGDAAVAAHFTFVSMRDAQHPRLALPVSGGLIELRAAPERLAAPAYRMTLLLDSQGQVERLDSVSGVRVGADGYLHSFADSTRLKPGSYSLRIEPEGGAPAAPLDFPFTLRSGADPSAQ